VIRHVEDVEDLVHHRGDLGEVDLDPEVVEAVGDREEQTDTVAGVDVEHRVLARHAVVDLSTWARPAGGVG
jgi:hypothetical protein